MFDLWEAFLNLLQLCDKIYEDPWSTMKSIEAERENAPKEYRHIYDPFIMLCKLKIIADSRNMTVIELVDEIVKDYVDRVWGDVYEHISGRGEQDSGSDT
jgi:hypothetical protein